MISKLKDTTSFTEQLLVDAGVEHGMHVLDLGCGTGDVSCLLAQLVGTTGHVIGIDRDASSIAKAQENAANQNLSNITFFQQDLSETLPEYKPFDAVVARRVLMYLPNLEDILQKVFSSLRNGGLAVFQESDATLISGRQTDLPLHDEVTKWMWQTVINEGANTHMGSELPKALEQVGFNIAHVRAAAEIEGYGFSLYSVINAIKDRIIHNDIATESQICIETLEERLAVERDNMGILYIPAMSFGVWARKV